MSSTDAPDAPPPVEKTASAIVFAAGYRAFSYFGLMSVMASLAWGFRYSPEAGWLNYLLDVLLYAAFVAPHLMLTRKEVKESVWGRIAGTSRERQFYIVLTIVTWLAVLWFHRPVPGPAFELPPFVRFAGMIGLLWTVVLFFEGTSRQALDGLFGVPGSELQHSHGDQTPLRTDGQYAQVRHPMYRAVVLMGLSSLVIHPNAAQLLWTLMLGTTFIGFIPAEEAQLLEARGDEYRRYCKQTPYRLFRGVW